MGVSFGNTVSSGIQDISALLPLLGTEQCEEHIGSALIGGYLYVAATSLSIFGSLGTVRAGFKVLIGSITFRPRKFIGAKKLRDAGFEPSGKAASMILFDTDKPYYLAETRFTEMLEKLHIENVDKLEVKGVYQSWNTNMFFYSAILAILSIAPYMHLILRDHSTLPASSRWAFPIIRSLGSFTVGTMVQLVIQCRVLEVVKKRVMFMTLDDFMKENHIRLLDANNWGPAQSSEECLWNLEHHLVIGDAARTNSAEAIYIPSLNQHRDKNIDASSGTSSEDAGTEAEDIESTGISIPEEFLGSNVGDDAGSGAVNVEAVEKLTGEPEEDIRVDMDQVNQYEESPQISALKEKLCKERKKHFPPKAEFLRYVKLVVFQIAILLGSVSTVIGYVGCFSLVQSSEDGTGPLIWLCLEILLSLTRTIIWASNPEYDESTGIIFTLMLVPDCPLVTCNKYAEEIDEEKVFPVVRNQDFLRTITSYTGLLTRFDDDRVSLYYTLTGSEKTVVRKLYVTIFDYRERASRLFVQGSQEGSTKFYDASLEVDVGDGAVGCRMNRRTSRDSNHITNEETFVVGLQEHCRSIVEGLRNRDRDSSNNNFVPIATDWTLELKPSLSDHRKDIPSEDVENMPNEKSKLTTEDLEYLGVGKLERLRRHLGDKRAQWIEEYMKIVRAETTNSWPKPSPEPTIVETSEAADIQFLFLVEREEIERILVEETGELESWLRDRNKNMANFVEASKVRTKAEQEEIAKTMARLAREQSRNESARLATEMTKTKLRLKEEREIYARQVEFRGYKLSDEETIEKRRKSLEEEIEKRWESVMVDFTDEDKSIRGPRMKERLENEKETAEARFMEAFIRVKNVRDPLVKVTWERSFHEMKERSARRRRQLEDRLRSERVEVEARLVLIRQQPGELEKYWSSEFITRLAISNRKYLRISDQDVANEGITAISRALARNTEATFIDLTDCYLEDEQVVEIAAAFEKAKSVTSIDISGRNGLEAKGVSALANALDKNKNILCMNMPEHYAVIQNLLERNRNTLREKKTHLIFYEDVLATDYYRQGYPYLLFTNTGYSRCVIAFSAPQKIRGKKLILRLNHCGTSADGIVDIRVNGKDAYLSYQDSPRDNFGVQDFPVSEFIEESYNEISITLAEESRGAYWLSDANLLVEEGEGLLRSLNFDEDSDSSEWA